MGGKNKKKQSSKSSEPPQPLISFPDTVSQSTSKSYQAVVICDDIDTDLEIQNNDLPTVNSN